MLSLPTGNNCFSITHITPVEWPQAVIPSLLWLNLEGYELTRCFKKNMFSIMNREVEITHCKFYKITDLVDDSNLLLTSNKVWSQVSTAIADYTV